MILNASSGCNKPERDGDGYSTSYVRSKVRQRSVAAKEEGVDMLVTREAYLALKAPPLLVPVTPSLKADSGKISRDPTLVTPSPLSRLAKDVLVYLEWILSAKVMGSVSLLGLSAPASVSMDRATTVVLALSWSAAARNSVAKVLGGASALVLTTSLGLSSAEAFEATAPVGPLIEPLTFLDRLRFLLSGCVIPSSLSNFRFRISKPRKHNLYRAIDGLEFEQVVVEGVLVSGGHSKSPSIPESTHVL
jgi:hypothetical protein